MTVACCLADDAALAALVPEWEALWRAVPDACPFLSPAWLLPWWHVWGNGTPRVAVLRTPDGRLEGVLPLYRLEGRLLNMGAGVSDRFDALLRPGSGAAGAGRLLAAALDGTALPCDLSTLPEDAVLRQAPAPPGWTDRDIPTEVCPVLDLSGGFDSIPALARRKWRMAAHRAERMGGWNLDMAEGATVGAGFERLLHLHGARWRQDGQEGVLASPEVRRFHMEALPLLQQAGALWLAGLHIAGRPAAAALALRAGTRRVLFYIGGWDPEFSFASPGTLLIGALLRRAVAEGAREADFLRGAESYKHRWGAADRALHTRLLCRA